MAPLALGTCDVLFFPHNFQIFYRSNNWLIEEVLAQFHTKAVYGALQ